jgi:transcriptional regulator with XRE-family HTH domain
MHQLGDGPTIARLSLGARLRALRTAAGITGGEAAAVIRSSGSKISRIESGLLPVRQRDVAQLLTLYGADGQEERERLLTMARESAHPGWWDPYSHELPAHIIHILNVEAAAALLLIYDPQAVPALLQTQAYAQAVASRGFVPQTWRGGLRADMLARRRGILTLDHAPRVWALLDEAVLLRSPDIKPGTLAGQLTRLIDDAAAKKITIQIVPRTVPDTLAAAGPFSILRLPLGRDLPDLVLLEQLTTMTTIERLRDVDRYWELWNRIAIQALNPDASLEFLRQAARSVNDGIVSGSS